MTRSSILAWKIPWIEEAGGLQSMRLQRVRYSNPKLLIYPSPPTFPPFGKHKFVFYFCESLSVL